MKERLRIFGVIVDNPKKSPTKDNLKGYVILDTKTYQLKFLTEDQTKMMLESYVFSNAEIGKKGEIENTECAMTRVVAYGAASKKPTKQGVTILGQVEGKSRYRIITQDGKVTTLDEGKILELIEKGMPLINGKIVKRGENQYISSIKGKYPVITERDRTEKLRGTARTVGNTKDHKRYIEKVDRRFRISLVKYWNLNNWGVPNTGVKDLKDTKKHNKFRRAVERYYEEYVKQVHPDIVEKAESVYGGVAGIDRKFEVIKAALYYEVLEKGRDKETLKPIREVDSEYARHHLYGNKEFMQLIKEVSPISNNFFTLMGIEVRMVYKEFGENKDLMHNLFGKEATPFSTDKKGGRPLRQQLVKGVISTPEFEKLEAVWAKEGIGEKPATKIAMRKFPIFGKAYTYHEITHNEEKRKEQQPVKVNNLEYPASLHVFGWGINEFREPQSLPRSECVMKNHDTVRNLYKDTNLSVRTEKAIQDIARNLGDFTTARDLIEMSNESKERKQEVLDNRKTERQREYIDFNSQIRGIETDPEDIEELLYILLRLNNKELYDLVLDEGDVSMDSKYRDPFWLEILDSEAETLEEEDRYYYESGFKCNTEYLPRNVYLPSYSEAPKRTETIVILNSRSNSGVDIKEQLGKLYIG